MLVQARAIGGDFERARGAAEQLLEVLAGLGTRLAAFGITAIMAGAALTAHASVGFFMNWSGAQPGEGFEYHLLAMALSVPLMVLGGGRFALDAKVGAHVTSEGAERAVVAGAGA